MWLRCIVLKRAVTPRPGDGEGNVRVGLDIDEQPLVLEGRAGELRTALVAAVGDTLTRNRAHALGSEVHVVLTEREDLSVHSQTVHAGDGVAAGFAEDQAAARASGDVVRVVQHVAIGRLVNQAEGFVDRIVGDDLAAARNTAADRADINDAVAVPHAFAPTQACGALHDALGNHAAVYGAGDEGLVRLLDIHPLDISACTRRLGDAGVVVGVRNAIDCAGGIGSNNEFHHLQPAAPGRPARQVGNEALETGRRAVLALVNDAGGRIDRDGFVAEAAHVDQRDRLGFANRRDVEAVAVLFGVGGIGVQAVGGFLAADPRIPIGMPSSMMSPVQPYDQYLKPSGRFSSGSPIASSNTGESGP